MSSYVDVILCLAKSKKVKELLISITSRTSEGLEHTEGFKNPQYINHYGRFFIFTVHSTCQLPTQALTSPVL